MDKHVFVDTSRVGGHYTKAIMLASALVNRNEMAMKQEEAPDVIYSDIVNTGHS
jgi:hypothetical protein